MIGLVVTAAGESPLPLDFKCEVATDDDGLQSNELEALEDLEGRMLAGRGFHMILVLGEHNISIANISEYISLCLISGNSTDATASFDESPDIIEFRTSTSPSIGGVWGGVGSGEGTGDRMMVGFM